MSWVKTTLGNVADIFSGYAFKSSDMNTENGTPLLKIKNIANSRVSPECDTFLNVDFDLSKYSRFLLKKHDFLVAMTGQGSVGRIGKMITYKSGYYVNQRVAIVRVNSQKANPNFIFSQVGTQENEKELFKKANGAGQPNISAKQIGELEIVLPDIETQNRIADILSTYDDLIENNQKQIKLLEEAAQRLYKEWFVDLRFPGYENTPIIDGVPQGWKKELVGNVIEKSYRSKQVMTADYLAEGKIPIIDQSRDFIAGYTDDEETLVPLDKPIIVFGDHTRILKYIQFPFAKGADGTQLIVSKCKNMPQSLLYLSLLNIDLSNYHYARHFKYLKAEEIIIPNIEIATKLDYLVSPIFKKVQILRDQIIGAQQARDRLLPKLMSGELEV